MILYQNSSFVISMFHFKMFLIFTYLDGWSTILERLSTFKRFSVSTYGGSSIYKKSIDRRYFRDFLSNPYFFMPSKELSIWTVGQPEVNVSIKVLKRAFSIEDLMKVFIILFRKYYYKIIFADVKKTYITHLILKTFHIYWRPIENILSIESIFDFFFFL